MFENYYQQQLNNLRKKATEFARAHPVIAPLLKENSIDPDVERLLEGTAFLNAILHEKIDDDLPEFIRGLAEIVFPHMLRPLPSAGILVFTPKDSLLETIRVPSGTSVASVPLEGTQCRFRTTMDLAISPLFVNDAGYEKSLSGEDVYTVQLRLNGISLAEWNRNELTFFVGGDFLESARFFMRLRTALQKIVVTSASRSFTLQPTAVSVPGFSSDALLYASKSQSFSRYSFLTEYFMFPEKFLFYTISGLRPLGSPGENADFALHFHMKPRRERIAVKKELFTLFAVPAVNLFPLGAEPVRVDHTMERMPLIPSCGNRGHYDIYTVDSVTGFIQGTVERRVYEPHNQCDKSESNNGFYQVHHSRSLAHNAHEVMISLCYDANTRIDREVLSVELTCTNAHLASRLKTGDIRIPTSESPELATFTNITAPTTQVDVLLEKNELWRLLSNFTTNLLPIVDGESLRELLRMYSFHHQRSDANVLNNLKRIDAIEGFSTRPVERIIKGILMRGILLRITFDETHFAGAGDAYLFCSVLDTFLSLYTSINTFTQLESINSKTGERLQWPPRIGEKYLL
ncbi:MAG: type VI secretion system baseplate subunit TssF [Chitinispirillaceae bacterium]|nr:type VI secretion system baseplate subunit TssF [Chitinispirillaceae bacterium]